MVICIGHITIENKEKIIQLLKKKAKDNPLVSDVYSNS